MKLNKRECSISIELIPCGVDFLKVVWNIGNDSFVFWTSSAVSYQFSSFIQAVYSLYSERRDNHDHNRPNRKRCKYIFPSMDPTLAEDEMKVETEVNWRGEGPAYEIKLSRICKHGSKNPACSEDDFVTVELFGTAIKSTSYTLDGRDLCYAVAKAYTDAIKTYGIYGYYFSTGNDCCTGDVIDLHMLLFIKAYALNAMEVRELHDLSEPSDSWQCAEGTSFEKELELLLFDM